ncbi:MAG: hypothetical protein ABFD20_10645 [Anaerolineales bacterium]
MIALVAMACSSPATVVPQPTPNYHPQETRVEAMLRATFTAMAPATAPEEAQTPLVTPLPSAQTPTATPAVLAQAGLLAYVRSPDGAEPSIVLAGQHADDQVTLEHLTGPQAITDLDWPASGDELLLVSAYAAILSRGNERNVLAVRTDGTGLRMLTGEYVPPEEAPGPYVSLEGRVLGGVGDCLVSAQGVTSPVSVDATGAFTLTGVPIGAAWARAVCTQEGRTLSGDVTLAAVDGAFAPVQIQVTDGGQGWKQATLSPDGGILAGTFYHWAPDAEGQPEYHFWGRIVGLVTGYAAELEVAQEGDLNGLDWAPAGDRLLGAVTGANGGWLWLWDATGASLGQLIEVPNPDDQILTLANPVWSPDGTQVAFELRRWSWWGDSAYRTDLMLVSADGQNLRPLVELGWGEHAVEPCWLPDGHTVAYEYVQTAAGQELSIADNGSIWMVVVDSGLRLPWSSGPYDSLPASNPRGVPSAKVENGAAAPEPTPTAG